MLDSMFFSVEEEHQRGLPENEVHVWHVKLNELMPIFPQFLLLLNEEERRRAARFSFEHDRAAFCLRRGVLRCLLESYGVATAGKVSFTYSSRGKPILASGQGSEGLNFNLSHSQGMAVYAMARFRRIGIDVECIRSFIEADDLVAQDFADEEKAAYEALPPLAREQGFFNAWTRKEAFLKALGEGLDGALCSFAVTLTPGELACFRRIDSKLGDVAEWLLADVTLDPTYAVAIAVEGTGLQLRNRSLDTANADGNWKVVVPQILPFPKCATGLTR
jgi:4'-phosphopantetheinyl transferase